MSLIILQLSVEINSIGNNCFTCATSNWLSNECTSMKAALSCLKLDQETPEVEKPFTQPNCIGLHSSLNYEPKMVHNNYMEGVCKVDS